MAIFRKLSKYIWHGNSPVFGKRLWILFAVIVAIIAFVRPTERVITHHYSNAAYNWWQEKDMYNASGAGFLYFPQSALVYTPFAWQKFPENLGEFNQKPFFEKFSSTIPLRLAEASFRIFAVLLLGYALWSVVRLFEQDNRLSLFFAASLLAVPASITAAGNGQFNILLSSTMLLSCAAVAQKKWNLATLWLILGIAVKPLGIVPLLLLTALNRPLWLRVILGLVIFMAFGFLHWNFDYALRQWQMMVEQLKVASQPSLQAFDDIAAMFRVFGLNLSHEFWFAVRALAAIITLGLGFFSYRKFNRLTATFVTATLGATYLMVFNPRTETNSYLIVAPYIALLAAMMFRDGKKDWIAWFLVFVCIGLGSDNYGDIYKITRIWWKPFITLVFGLLFSWWILRETVIRNRVELPELKNSDV